MASREEQRASRIGLRSGKLVITRYLGIVTDKKTPFYEARCDCGKFTRLRWGDFNKKDPKKCAKSCGCLSIAKPDTSSITFVFSNYIGGAKTRGHEFSLSYDHWYQLTQLPCHYCGILGSNKYTATSKRRAYQPKPFVYNGIDRVDSSKGYTPENCVPCCKLCNRAKSNLPKDQFVDWIKRTYTHIFEKGLSNAPHIEAKDDNCPYVARPRIN